MVRLFCPSAFADAAQRSEVNLSIQFLAHIFSCLKNYRFIMRAGGMRSGVYRAFCSQFLEVFLHLVTAYGCGAIAVRIL